MNISERVLDIAISELAKGGAEIRNSFGNVGADWMQALREEGPFLLFDGLRGIVFADKMISAVLKPFTTMANVTASLPARIGLSVILNYTDDDLFPGVKRSRVMTEQAAAAEAVRQIALAGLEAGGFSIKATSALGILMAATESAAGGRGRLALLLTGQIGKYASKAISGRFKAVVVLVIDGLLRAAFSVCCLFTIVWLVNAWGTTALLPQDNPRIRVSGTRRVRTGGVASE